jgi:hypothetical protein
VANVSANIGWVTKTNWGVLISSTRLLNPHGVATFVGLSKASHELGDRLCASVLHDLSPSSVQRFRCRLHTKLRGLNEAFFTESSRAVAFAQDKAATNLALTPQRDRICQSFHGNPACPEQKRAFVTAKKMKPCGLQAMVGAPSAQLPCAGFFQQPSLVMMVHILCVQLARVSHC